jgi:GDP-L-fucose synthase
LKSVLITGGRGFIARNLAEHLPEHLKQSWNVTVPGRFDLDLTDEDATQDFLARRSFDVILHCATHNASRNPTGDVSKVLHNNLRMYFNLIRANAHFGRLIYFGSGADYDMRHYRPLMPEDYFGKHVPADDYGFSKYVMQRHAQTDRKVLNLRIFGVFGKYEDWEIRFISNAICKALYDRPISLRQNVRFDYLWAEDLVRITAWFMENEVGFTDCNVCTSDVIDLVSLAELVRDVSGKDVPIQVDQPGMKAEYSGDNRRMLAAMGGFAFTDRREAVKRLYEWYDANRSAIDPAKLATDK